MRTIVIGERVAFRNGHVHHRQPCVTCGRPTRRTVLRVTGPEAWERTRYVLCARCKLPTPEERLLMAIVNVTTLPELETAARKCGR